MPTTLPTVSVCIPTRNRADDLVERFAELRTQTYRELDIVLVDDGSTDETPTVVRAAQAADPRIRYLRFDRPLGVPEVTERCLAEAWSDVVALFHDHDSYRPDAVERLARALSEVPEAAFAFTGVRTIDPLTGHIIDISSDPAAPRSRTDVVAHFVMTGSSLVGASAVMVRRSRLPVPSYNRALGLFADVELWCRLALEAPAAYDPGPLVDVRGWDESESLSKLNWRMLGALAALRAALAREMPTRPLDLFRIRTRIQLDTLVRRASWTARLLRHARCTEEDLSATLVGSPLAVRTLVLAVRMAPGITPLLRARRP